MEMVVIKLDRQFSTPTQPTSRSIQSNSIGFFRSVFFKCLGRSWWDPNFLQVYLQPEMHPIPIPLIARRCYIHLRWRWSSIWKKLGWAKRDVKIDPGGFPTIRAGVDAMEWKPKELTNRDQSEKAGWSYEVMISLEININIIIAGWGNISNIYEQY